MNDQLDKKQRQVVDILLDGGNVIMYGAAGTGKTFVINILKSIEKVVVIPIAPTAIAASHISGTTIHSMFMIPPTPLPFLNGGYWDVAYVSKTMNSLIMDAADEKIELLIIVIDEISMVSADLMNALMMKLKAIDIKISILLSGDMAQLEPVGITRGHFDSNQSYQDAYVTMNNMYGNDDYKPYYKAPDFKDMEFTKIHLDINHRQKDDVSIRNMHGIRNAKNNVKSKAKIMKWSESKVVNIKSLPEDTLVVSPSNKGALQYNLYMLNKIDSPLIDLSVTDDELIIKNLNKKFNVFDAGLKIKIGARVVIRKNINKHFYNGKICTVTGYNKSTGLIELDDMDWISKVNIGKPIVKYSFETGIESKFEGSNFQQYPITLAWAITVHKAQGTQADRVHIMNGFMDSKGYNNQRSMSFGQLYTAISRCTDVRNITFSKKLRLLDIRTRS